MKPKAALFTLILVVASISVFSALITPSLSQPGLVNFRWIGDTGLALCGQPEDRSQWDTLRSWGISATINLRSGQEDDKAYLNSMGISYYYLPIIDWDITPKQTDDGVHWINGELKQGKKVLIHCGWGVNRAPTMACMWYVHEGHTPSEAYAWIIQYPISELSVIQKQAVNDYYVWLAQQPPEKPSSTNILQNPSVENDGDFNGIPDYWSFYKAPSIFATCSWVSEGRTGQKGTKIIITYNSITGQKESALWYQQTSKIVVGETYSFRVWYRSNIQSTILLLTYSGSSIVKVMSLNLPPSSSWIQSGWVRTTIPLSITSLRADCRLFNMATGWVIFDDLELVSSVPLEPEPITPTPETNMVLNPSVEDLDLNNSPDYWMSFKTSNMLATLSYISESHTGQKAIKIVATYNSLAKQTESALWYQNLAQFSVGKTYRFRVWYKSSVQPTIILLAFGSSNQLKGASLDLPVSNSWVQSEWVSITVPSGTTSLRADARLFNRAIGWAVFDDFELVRT